MDRAFAILRVVFFFYNLTLNYICCWKILEENNLNEQIANIYILLGKLRKNSRLYFDGFGFLHVYR